MAEIVLFKPKSELTAAANLQRFIEMCRTSLTVFGIDLVFQDNVWNVTEEIATRGRGNKHERITFSSLATVDDESTTMMSEPFLSFAKAYIRYMHGVRPTKAIHTRLAAMRALESSLSENGNTPNPINVDTRVLNRTSQLIADRFSESTAYRVGQQLEIAAAFMAENGLTVVPVRWRNPISRPNSLSRVGREFDLRREEKLPSSAALDALPRIFRLATEAADVITSSAAAVLLSAPDRISELLTLPESCEVNEINGDRESYGLRWWPAKDANPTVKWVVPSMASVVKDALQKIRTATAEARRIAKWYETYPDRLYLSTDVEHLRDQEWISLSEIAQIIGLSNSSAANTWRKANELQAEMRGNGRKFSYIRFSDLERAIIALLPRNFPFIDQATGLKYSEALFIVRKHELGNQRGTYRCMVEPVDINQINTRLGSRTAHGFQSIFSRFGFTEPDGSPISITSHQFRHYLNTLAQASGLSQLDIAKWSGRLDIRQNEAYDHVTPEQLLRKIRSAVGGDEMFGPLKELSAKVMIRRDEFARLIIPTAHTTDFGYCVHDYTASPCQLHLDCIHCQELVCVKGEETKTQMLRQRLGEVQRLILTAEEAVSEGYSGSDRWLIHHRSALARLLQLVKIMDDPNVPSGAVIQLSGPITQVQEDGIIKESLFPHASTENDLQETVNLVFGGNSES